MEVRLPQRIRITPFADRDVYATDAARPPRARTQRTMVTVGPCEGAAPYARADVLP
ncbi:hypothetical protein ACF1A5_06090 [Streptomyces sp. NPDC014864]|uniref:hypothetical protein n=1 Tax=Streptomyces sp. NPDC014864 TaxID=3364924 RepID=UPI0036FDF347